MLVSHGIKRTTLLKVLHYWESIEDGHRLNVVTHPNEVK